MPCNNIRANSVNLQTKLRITAEYRQNNYHKVFWQWVSMSNISSIHKNFFRCHKNTQNNTLWFKSKLLLSSGKTTNPKTQMTKNGTPTSTQLTCEKKKKPVTLKIWIPNMQHLKNFLNSNHKIYKFKTVCKSRNFKCKSHIQNKKQIIFSWLADLKFVYYYHLNKLNQ